MTSEEKVLADIEEKLRLLMVSIEKLRVTEIERKDFEKERADFKLRLDDYKLHKKQLDDRIEKWNSSHQ